MKLTVILMLAFALNLSATGYSQNKLFNLDLRGKTIREVFDVLEKQSKFRFFYNDELKAIDKTIDLTFAEKNIQQVLDNVLASTDVTYRVFDNNLIVVTLKQNLLSVKISGTVKAPDGSPLPGVTVLEKGTTNGTITDADGKYQIEVSSGDAVLVFSSVGYASQEIALQGKSSVDITMEEKSEEIEDIVVIGYGTVKKSDVTGSVSSVSQSTLKEVPVTNVAQSMMGRISGVQISQTSTRPGDATQIRVRGTRSLSASNDPLLIVDGIPFMGTFNDINPGDIKSIDILKDASATAIYGSRGSNGVILITTNRGSVNRTTFKYSGYAGFGNVARQYDVFSADEYIAMKNQPGVSTTFPLLSQETTNGQANALNTNWQDLMYETAKIQSHDISISGGNDKFSGNTGLGYYKETSVLPGQGYKRFTGRLVLDINVNEWFKFGLNSQNAFSIKDGENANNMFNMLANSPLVAPYDASGNIVVQPHNPREDSYSPLLDKNSALWKQQRNRFSTLNSAYAEVKFLPWIKYRLNLGLNYAHDNYGDFYSSQSSFKAGGLSSASTSSTSQYNYAVENLLYIDKSFGDHTFGLTLMQSAEKQFYSFSSISGQNMLADYMQYYNLGMSRDGVSVDGNTQSYWEKALLSFMGRFNYSYKGKYLVTATLRRDGASVLSEGHQYHTYPAVALAWNAKKESFLESINILSALKVRLGYGQTSNQSVNPYETLGSMSQNKYNFGTTYVNGYYVNKLLNPEVGWEYTKAYNAGLDFGILKDRISGSIDVYLQKTSDVLVQQKLLASTGVLGSILANVGETENKGFEVSLHTENFVPKTASGFSWTTDFNIGVNRNKIVSLSSGQLQDVSNGWFVGQPIDVIYDYTKLGIWQTEEAAEAIKYDKNNKPGDIKIKDLNGDFKIDETNDKSVIHKFEPDFSFGFSTRFSYQNFDLSIVTYGQVGGTLVSTIHQGWSYLNRLDGRRNNLDVNYWTTTNPTNDYPRIDPGTKAVYNSTLGYFDATYWKIKTITLGYNVPEKFAKYIKLSGIRVYVSCNNVATLFSPYIKAGGVDPQPTNYFRQENGGGIQQTRQLVVGLNTPPTRQVLFGIDLKF